MLFLYGFLAAWFIFALLFFLSEEKGVPFTVLYSKDWMYYLLAAPVLLPIVIVLFPAVMAVRGYKRLQTFCKMHKMNKKNKDD